MGLHGPSRAFEGPSGADTVAEMGRGLFLRGCRAGGPECGRGDGDAARMTDDRVPPPLIADETGAAGTAEQGCQWYAREFCHSWFHNIIPVFRPAGRWNARGGPVAHRAFQPITWMETDSRESRLRRLPLVTAQQCVRPALSGQRRRGPSTDAAQVPLASAIRSSDTHRR